jgi:hypothetical protein
MLLHVRFLHRQSIDKPFVRSVLVRVFGDVFPIGDMLLAIIEGHGGGFIVPGHRPRPFTGGGRLECRKIKRHSNADQPNENRQPSTLREAWNRRFTMLST